MSVPTFEGLHPIPFLLRIDAGAEERACGIWGDDASDDTQFRIGTVRVELVCIEPGQGKEFMRLMLRHCRIGLDTVLPLDDKGHGLDVSHGLRWELPAKGPLLVVGAPWSLTLCNHSGGMTSRTGALWVRPLPGPSHWSASPRRLGSHE